MILEVGIYSNGEITIYNGNISGNSSNSNAGGIGVAFGELNINNGIINNNTAILGGGIYIAYSTLSMNNTTINGNIADNGAGIYARANGIMDIAADETCYITNNIANNNGGGIYTEDTVDYANIQTSNNTIFSGNSASVAYRPSNDVKTSYPNIGFANTSIIDHPLNNYDINYIGEEELILNVTYDANGGNGNYVGPNIKPGNTDIVLTLPDTGISHPNRIFKGWNTEPNGSGTSYQPEDSIVLRENVTLYAQWRINPCVIYLLISIILVIGIIFLQKCINPTIHKLKYNYQKSKE